MTVVLLKSISFKTTMVFVENFPGYLELAIVLYLVQGASAKLYFCKNTHNTKIIENHRIPKLRALFLCDIYLQTVEILVGSCRCLFYVANVILDRSGYQIVEQFSCFFFIFQELYFNTCYTFLFVYLLCFYPLNKDRGENH